MQQHLSVRPNHVAYAVASISETAAWYERIFGFKIIAEWELESLNTKAAMLSNVHYKIELFEKQQASPTPADDHQSPTDDFTKRGLIHVALTVESITEAKASLERLHVPLVTKINQNPVLKDRWLFIKDPNGVFIELVEEAG